MDKFKEEDMKKFVDLWIGYEGISGKDY